MTWILGINSALNASAVLLKDGATVFGIQEERLTRVKNDPGYPTKSISACLEFAGIDKKDIDLICVGGKSKKILRSREKYLEKFHQRYASFRITSKKENALDFLYRAKNKILSGADTAKLEGENLDSYLEADGFLDRTQFFDHHLCHAASAYYGLNNDVDEKCLIFTLDGGGDKKTAGVYIGHAGNVNEISFSQSMSLASLYAHITYILGFVPHEHEYKLMGLAPYANPQHAENTRQLIDHLVTFSEKDPLCFVNPNYEDSSSQLVNPKPTLEWIKDLYDKVQFSRFDNLAAGSQLFVEELVIEWVKRGIQTTGIRNISLSGGFFMNVKVNQLISQMPGVSRVSCFPSCGDETNAFGAAFLGASKLAYEKKACQEIAFKQFCVGSDPKVGNGEIPSEFIGLVESEKLENINKRIAAEIVDGKIVARCSGPMEFGARALGNRSILAATNNFDNIQKINRAIKKRDFWMPFAPAMLLDRAERYIDIPSSLDYHGSPYMMFTFNTKPEFVHEIICGSHQADGTVRAQLVTADLYPDLSQIIREVDEISGIPAVLNTSFNLHGFPIVTSTWEAIDVFLKSELDLLFVDDFLFSKVK